MGDYAKIVHAPLNSIPSAGQDFVWYSPDAAEAVSSVHLIVIDGPPMVTGPMARYPAVPVLAEKISPGTILLLDDANRAEEQEAVRGGQSSIHPTTLRFYRMRRELYA